MKGRPKDPSQPMMGNHPRSKSSITFGYDNISARSNYMIDYGLHNSDLSGCRELLPKQPPQAEILPQIHGSTKEPWMTTSRRDIPFYSNDLRRKLYYQQLQEFNRMRNMYRMRHWSSGSYHLPPITSYNIDYRYLLLPSIQLKAKN